MYFLTCETQNDHQRHLECGLQYSTSMLVICHDLLSGEVHPAITILIVCILYAARELLNRAAIFCTPLPTMCFHHLPGLRKADSVWALFFYPAQNESWMQTARYHEWLVVSLAPEQGTKFHDCTISMSARGPSKAGRSQEVQALSPDICKEWSILQEAQSWFAAVACP